MARTRKQYKWSLYSDELGNEFNSDSLVEIYQQQKRLTRMQQQIYKYQMKI